MNALVALLVAAPLLAAGLSLALSRVPVVQRLLGVLVLSASTAASVALLVDVERNGIRAVHLGGWPAPIGITLVVDTFAALMLVVATATLLGVLVYAIASPATRDHALFFHPIYLVLAAGVSSSFLTADLFNLFVSFEVMLAASYVLITLGGSRSQIRSGMTYVVISLVASTLLLTAIALIYAATGTVNMADLSEKLPLLSDGVKASLGLMLLVALGTKAAIFPLFFWLPDSYPTAPTPVTAIFAGLLTKVGVYAIVRTQTLMFAPDSGSSTLLLWIAGFTMIVGVLGAIAQDDMKRILSFHIISQIGYMVMGLGLYTVAGVAATVFFIVHQIPIKTALFLVTGIVEQMTGTAALRRLGGMVRSTPVLAILFLFAALSLAGIPPLSGFVGKLALVDAGFSARSYTIVAVSLVGSVLTLYSMTKIWGGVFWGVPEVDPGMEPIVVKPAPAGMTWVTGAVVAMTVAIAVAAGPIFEMSEHAAEALLGRDEYVQAVFER